MATIAAIVLIALKFFGFISISWTITILFAVTFILIEMYNSDVASARFLRNLSCRVNDLESEIDDIRSEFEANNGSLDWDNDSSGSYDE